jgi:membrane protein
MSISTTPTPIPGEVIDPPPKPTPEAIERLEGRRGVMGVGVGVGFRAYTRFSEARVTLLAAGTTYYLFLAMFSIITFAYGLTAALGAERMASYVTEALSEAFPGLLGAGGIDPAQLRTVGQATSVVGAVGLLYGGTGSVVAASRSIHSVYGAAKDPRNFVLARLRALGWLFVLAPLILLSYVASSFVTNLSDQILGAVGIGWRGPDLLLNLAALVLTLGANFLIVYVLLRRMGGIRPSRRAALAGAAAGAVAIEVLKTGMTLLVQLTIDKPQYGAFAAPIGVLFVLYLQSMAVYGAAALTAGVAERDVPVEVSGAADAAGGPAKAEDAPAKAEDAPDEAPERQT